MQSIGNFHYDNIKTLKRVIENKATHFISNNEINEIKDYKFIFVADTTITFDADTAQIKVSEEADFFTSKTKEELLDIVRKEENLGIFSAHLVRKQSKFDDYSDLNSLENIKFFNGISIKHENENTKDIQWEILNLDDCLIYHLNRYKRIEKTEEVTQDFLNERIEKIKQSDCDLKQNDTAKSIIRRR